MKKYKKSLNKLYLEREEKGNVLRGIVKTQAENKRGFIPSERIIFDAILLDVKKIDRCIERKKKRRALHDNQG
jgi:hypothetical protein